MYGFSRQRRPFSATLVVCAVVVCGCASWQIPRIDPSGERFFVPANAPVDPVGPVYREFPGPATVCDREQLVLHPLVSVAPVGSEVVLLAGVVDPDQYLRTNQRIEWSLDPSGAGFFVDLNRKTWADRLVLDANRPQKIDNHYAIGSTSREYLRLTRGTPTPADDVTVQRGQAWITVSSAVEGTSYVTAMSPCVYGWEARKQTAVIHWIDAQWSFPPPAINPAGTRHTFTTTVLRQTDQSPCAGWIVRYEIADGPPAGFAPEGAQAIEVPTNASGQACAEIFQQQPTPGTNRVSIQIIRPANFNGGHGQALVIGRGGTLKTWSAPGLTIRKTGPAVASLGATVTYGIDVSNPGDLPAEDVLVSEAIPQGLTLISSNPPGQAAGGSLRWSLGRLAPAETRHMEVNYRVERQGTITNCAEVSAQGGLKGRECVTTTVSAASIDVKILGPTQAALGSEVTFEIEVTNRSPVPVSGLLIKDRFDAGLKHAEAESPIERDLAVRLAPGQSERIGVAFRVVQPGPQCQTVEIRDRSGVLATARACVTGVESGQPAAKPAPSEKPSPGPVPGPTPGASKPPAAPATVTLKVNGPTARTVGETAEFAMEVTNTGSKELKDLKLVSQLDPTFDPSFATAGYKFEGADMVWAIASLPAGNTNKYQLHARCVNPAPQACHRVQVTTAQGVAAEQRACLEIRAVPGAAPPSLSLTIEDRRDPITVGKELTYDIEVFNNGPQPDGNTVVLVSVPPEMVPVRLQTVGPTGYTVEGQTVRFNPVPRIEPGKSIVYRVRVLAKLPGVVFLRAQLTSQGLKQPLLAEQKTQVNPK
jgi:uncharacterized repeat protein (TIGR01451 family)